LDSGKSVFYVTALGAQATGDEIDGLGGQAGFQVLKGILDPVGAIDPAWATRTIAGEF
jgi:hypothetical protein